MSATNSTVNMGVPKGQSIFDTLKKNLGSVLFGITAIGLFISSFVQMSNFAGSKDDWNTIKPQVTKVWIYTIIATVFLVISAFLFFIQDQAKTMYFMLIVTCLSLGLSYSALAIATISR